MLFKDDIQKLTKGFEAQYRGVNVWKSEEEIEWIYGDLRYIKDGNCYMPHIVNNESGHNNSVSGIPVQPASVGRFTGVVGTDSTGETPEAIFEGDIVDFLGMVGEIVLMAGAYGISLRYSQIDWDAVEKKIPEVTGCNNRLSSCMNDNFISLWEIIWNFNVEEANCGDLIKVLGNAYENYDLLLGGKSENE